MKKVFLLLVISLLAFSSVSFAAYKAGVVTLAHSAGTVSEKAGLKIELSNKVSLSYDGIVGGLGYSIAAYHASGTRTFGSTSGDAKIFWIDGTGTAAVTAPSGTASGDFSSWTAL